MKRIIKSIVAVCLSAVTCIAVSACGGKKTDTAVPPDENGSYSIITKLDLKVEFDGDAAAAKVKNTFTLFPATARVQAYLYYSETETNSYAEMTEVATEYIEDLNLGKTLTASWDTKGRGGYFRARMRYKIDNREWEERVTGQYRRDYTKPVLEPIPDDGSLPVFEDVQPIVPYLTYYNNYNYQHIYSERYYSYNDTEELTYEHFENETLKGVTDSIEKEFYIFNPTSNDCIIGANYFLYAVYKGTDDYILEKSMVLYVPKLGFENPPGDDLTGFGWWNIDFNLMFINIENHNLCGRLKLEFGKCDKINNNNKDKFINMYIGDFCIGTCYYKTVTAEAVTHAYFYNLFAKGLRII